MQRNQHKRVTGKQTVEKADAEDRQRETGKAVAEEEGYTRQMDSFCLIPTTKQKNAMDCASSSYLTTSIISREQDVKEGKRQQAQTEDNLTHGNA